jgi:hypothetical protein
VALIDLRPVQVETGIIFGQECYLDPARAREFLTKVNEIFPNFFTRYDFQPLPNRFVLENSNGTRRCIVELNKFIYSVQGSAEPSNFLHEIEKIFDCFRYLFALEDVRRIGKIHDLQFPANFQKKSLSNILKIEEPVQVNNMQLLFLEEGRNINIHFKPLDKGVIEFEGRRIDLEPGIIVRCDINNINMSLPLNIPRTIKEIFEFADQYVQTNLVKFLEKHFGDAP